MLKTLTAGRTRKNCPHLEATITLNHGIQRTVCRACGHITLEFVEDGVGEHTVMTWSGMVSRAS